MYWYDNDVGCFFDFSTHQLLTHNWLPSNHKTGTFFRIFSDPDGKGVNYPFGWYGVPGSANNRDITCLYFDESRRGWQNMSRSQTFEMAPRHVALVGNYFYIFNHSASRKIQTEGYGWPTPCCPPPKGGMGGHCIVLNGYIYISGWR